MFARGIWPDRATADPTEMRDEAEDILGATAVDMRPIRPRCNRPKNPKAQAANRATAMT